MLPIRLFYTNLKVPIFTCKFSKLISIHFISSISSENVIKDQNILSMVIIFFKFSSLLLLIVWLILIVIRGKNRRADIKSFNTIKHQTPFYTYVGTTSLATLKNVSRYKHLVKLVPLTKLHRLLPAIVALVKISSYTAELNKLVLL